MTPTATYIAEENCLQLLPTMEKPGLPPDQTKYDSLQEWREDTWNWSLKHSAYTKAVNECPRIPCDPSCKGLWQDGDVLEEGKDYKLKFQFLFSKEPEKWITCDQPFYRNMDVPERPIAFPLVPVKSEDQDALWGEVFDYLKRKTDYTSFFVHQMVDELKSKYSLTKR